MSIDKNISSKNLMVVIFIISICFVFSIGVKAQVQVSGKVIDSVSGEPLPGVNIKLKGTSTGTSSDINGKYDLTAPSLQDTLIFSFIGFQTRQIAINGRKHIDVTLKSKTLTGEDLVVVGYGTQKEISVTGAVSSLEAPDTKLEKLSQPSLVNMLAGQIPSVITRQSSGEPGYDQAQLFIRGKSTFHNNNPLVLVDGVPRGMNNINPQEIQSLTVLKDASATAVYGARGANGVILIKTKRGHAGNPHVSVRTEVGRLTGLRLPNYIGGAEYAKLVNEANQHVGLSPTYSSDDIQKFKNGSEPYLYPDVDWTNKILKKHTFQSIDNVSVSGGGENMKYYTNIAYTRRAGLYKEDNLNKYRTNNRIQRYNFRANIDANLSENLSLYLGMGGIIQTGHYPGTGSPAIFRSLKITTPIEYPPENPDGSIAGGPSYKSQNPWGLVTQSGYSTQERHTIQSTLKANWDLSSLVTEGLSLNGKFAYDYYSADFINRMITFGLKQYLGKGPNGEGQYNVVREGQPMGYGRGVSADNRKFYLQSSLKYKYTFLDKHEVGGLLLFNQQNYINLAAGNSTDALPHRRRGVSGRVTYGYDQRYLAEFDFGYTGSENFANGHKYGFFPSISAGWVISNEKFWNVPFINQFKLRGSWGEVGNDNIPGRRFLYMYTITKNANTYWFGADQQAYSGFDEGNIGNPDITWETAIKKDLGLDVHFIEDKVSLQVDIYDELRKNILMQRQTIPVVTGYFPWIVPYGNLGRVRNRGLDGRLKLNNRTTGGVYYSFRGNFTFAHNKVLANDEPHQKYEYQSAIGHSVGAPFGYKAIGFFKNQQDINQSPKQNFSSTLYPGDVKYTDVNGDGVVNDYDKVYLDGYPRDPEITFGFGGSVAWKGLQLSVFFSGATRAYTFIDREAMWPFWRGPGTYNVYKEYYNNRWTPDTKESAEYPAVTPGDNTNNYQNASSVYFKDASYIRWKNATLAYTLPNKISHKLGMSSFKIYVNGTNLLTFDKLHFINPESNYGTTEYPIQRGINAGIQIDFK